METRRVVAANRRRLDHAQGPFQPMTRKRDRRSSPPSFGSRNPPPAAPARRKGRALRQSSRLPAQAPATVRANGGRRRFRSSMAFTASGRRSKPRGASFSSLRHGCGGRAAQRRNRCPGLETRIMAPEEISARAPRDAVHQGLLLEARPLAPIDVADLPANGLCWFSTRSRTLTMSARFCERARLSRSTRWSRPSATRLTSPGRLRNQLRGGSSMCRFAASPIGAGARGDGGHGLLADRARFGCAGRLTNETISRPLALVLGDEDKGLRRLTRERCDRLARLDLPGAIKSLSSRTPAPLRSRSCMSAYRPGLSHGPDCGRPHLITVSAGTTLA